MNMAEPNELSEYVGVDLLRALGTTEVMVNFNYLQNLSRNGVARFENLSSGYDKLRLFKLKSLNYERGIDVTRCFGSVFSAVARYDASVVYLLRFDGNYVELYLGVSCETKGELSMVYDTFQGAFLGSFKGCDGLDKTLSNEETDKLLAELFDYEDNDNISVAAISGIAESNGSENTSKLFGLERLIDGMNHERFVLVVLAEAIPADTITTVRNGYEDLYNSLAPFQQCTLNISASNTKTYAQSVGRTISKTLTQTSGITKGYSRAVSSTKGSSESEALLTPKNRAIDVGTSLFALGGMAALLKSGALVADISLAGILMGGAYLIGPLTNLIRATFSDTKRSETKNSADTETDTHHEEKSENTAAAVTDAANESETLSDAHAEGKSLQYTYRNHAVESLLRTIEQRTNSLRRGESEGAFAVSTYIISADNATTNRAASLYRSTFAKVSIEDSNIYVNTWDDRENTANICAALRSMRHPEFFLADDTAVISKVTTCTAVIAQQLPKFFLLPVKSLTGLTVTEHAQFFREGGSDVPYESRLHLGNLYHMGTEERIPIFLDAESMAMHTFITGTTGKSTAIYNILDSLHQKGLPFMVIEPVKGEYKNLFGHFEDVHVFGTNGKYLPVLRIDPFSFPPGIHILEHLDGLTEIFNVCWPLYAAMPAILKDGLERAYKVAGWNLKTSVNSYGARIFPTLADVMHQIRTALDESEYSDENKGNYVGSLCTRLKSLTNGLGGTIFSSNAIDESILFDESVILDLSRIRSSETKALIMGLLILKLQEYRQSTATESNQKLRHVTILEEAHNLMRTERVQQSGESSNMIQKSVEMIANAIAEVRTYGEGFIIADQAPEQLDSSAIRNTNTKIVFRLPKAGDREITGSAMSLNYEQIHELAKLPTGVAAVYQNDWQGATLVKLPRGRQQKIFLKPDTFAEDLSSLQTLRDAIVSNKLATWIQNFGGLLGSDEDGMKAFLKLNCSAALKCAVLDYARHNVKERRQYLRPLAYAYFNADEVLTKTKHHRTAAGWRAAVREMIEPSVKDLSERELDFLLSLLIWVRHQRDAEYSSLYCLFSKYLQTRSPLGVVL